MPAESPVTPPPPALVNVVERNIATLTERRREAARQATGATRVAAAITRFSGSMPFVYIHLALVAAWVAINVGWTPVRPFDPSFVVLATAASVEAIFLSTFVLISQNQTAAADAARADLDLQVSLLAEHETTRLLRLVVAIADRLGIDAAADDELDELQQDVAPEKVLDHMDAQAADAEVS
ncbi:MAG TPA: DUF1003 domain-containing protein [Rubricoccaceae bacterium]|jgi:uncharacterized membrane protein